MRTLVSRRTSTIAAVAIGMTAATGLIAAPAAQATQYLSGLYCGASSGGQYTASSDKELKKAATAHSTGTVCSQYWVRSHYTVSGTPQWDTWLHGTYAVTDNVGYPVDQAQHDTDASSVITTY